VFAYLKGCPGIEDCLATLLGSGFPTLAVCEDLPRAAAERLQGPRLRIGRQPLNLDVIADTCDLGITNASHGVTASLLLGGKPLLQLPVFVEQFLIANRVAQLGAGTIVPPGHQPGFDQALRTMLGDDRFRQAAKGFAQRHSDHDPSTLASRVSDRLEQLVRQS